MADLDSKPISTRSKQTDRCDDVNAANSFSSTASLLLTGEECDERLMKMQDGVELALHRAKMWSKYAKDISIYIEKRVHFALEHARNLIKLAQTMKPMIKDECFLPYQELFCSSLEQELENQRAYVANYTLVLGHKFIEPLNARRLEHEKIRKSIKTIWAREQKRVQEAQNNLRKARDCYVTRRLDLQRARHALRTLLEAGNAGNATMATTTTSNHPTISTSSLSTTTAATPSIHSIHSTSSASSGLHSTANVNLNTALPFTVGMSSSLSSSTSSHAASCNVAFPSSLAAAINNNSVNYSTQLASSGVVGADVRSASTTCALAIASSASDSSTEQLKIERKRKLEEEAVQKALEAETAYKYSVLEANERSQACEQVKRELLKRLRELMLACDQTMKVVTVSYWQLMHTITAAEPVQFQQLADKAKNYEIGSQYAEFVASLRDSPKATASSPFAFIPFEGDLISGHISGGPTATFIPSSTVIRSPPSCSSTSLSSSSALKSQTRVKPPSDSESAESAGEDSSGNRLVPGNGSSGEELDDPHSSALLDSPHQFEVLRTPSQCRECDNICFQGFECTLCGVCVHKKCANVCSIRCGNRPLPLRMTTFGVPLSGLCNDSQSLPILLTKCVQEIHRRGLNVKGLYRVSGVKSRVEKLCQAFETRGELIDLRDINPNVLAGVLKLFLRQLPEPLLTFALYSEFINIAKQWPATRPENPLSVSSSVSTFAHVTPNVAFESNFGRTQRQLIKQLKQAVNKLPEVHLTSLAYLIKHLRRVADQQEENHMSASNLGIVFGPTLLRTCEEQATLSSLVDTVHQSRVVELLIMYCYELFGGNLMEDADLFETPNSSQPSTRLSRLEKSATTPEVRSNCTTQTTSGELITTTTTSNVSISSAVSSTSTSGSNAADTQSLESQVAGELQQMISKLSYEDQLAGELEVPTDRNNNRASLPSNLSTVAVDPLTSNSNSSTSRPNLNELRRQFFTQEPTSYPTAKAQLASQESLNEALEEFESSSPADDEQKVSEKQTSLSYFRTSAVDTLDEQSNDEHIASDPSNDSVCTTITSIAIKTKGLPSEQSQGTSSSTSTAPVLSSLRLATSGRSGASINLLHSKQDNREPKFV